MSGTARATAWSITINNPSPDDEEDIARARQKGWKVEGQLERGDEGTPHYQLLVKTPQVRFSAIKATFSRGHIEVCRNIQALQQYVHKEDTKEAELPSTNKLYPSLTRLWEMWDTFNRSLNIHPNDMSTVKDLEANFERFVHYTIREGYYVESIASNPATISMVRKYGFSILEREAIKFHTKNDDMMRRQLDRQTEDTEAL